MATTSMTTADANQSFLADQVGALVVQPVQAESVAAQVATVIGADPATHQFRVPIVADDPTAAWTAEGTEIAASDMDLAEVVSPFYKVAGLTVISNELADDSDPAAANLIGAGLARDIARKLDAAFFGTNAEQDAQPAGLLDLTDTGEIDAGSTWGNVDPFIEAVYASADEGATITTFVANSADAKALAKLKESSASNRNLLQPDPTQPTRQLTQAPSGLGVRGWPRTKAVRLESGQWVAELCHPNQPRCTSWVSSGRPIVADSVPD